MNVKHLPVRHNSVIAHHTRAILLAPDQTPMKPFIVLFFAFSSLFTQAQITGVVRDESAKPLEFVNVYLMQSSDSMMMKVSVSDSSGVYTFESIPSGNYYLQFRQPGYVEVLTAAFDYAEGDNYRVPEVALAAAQGNLDALEVVYTKPLVEIKADKTVFNVEGTTNAIGLNALELLRKAPGVMVDNNENIMVKGKGGIIVFIDGKRTPLDGDGLKNMLKNMQSSNIESIEIITNPSAKYDAAGNAGIINIRLKKNKNIGTNGSVSLGYGVQRYSKYNTNFTLNHRTEKWNLYGMYGNNWGKSWSYMDFERKQNGLFFDQFSDNSSDGLKHNYKAGADYFINKKHSVGMMVSGMAGENNWYGDTRTVITDILPEDNRVLIAKSRNSGRNDNISFNANYHFADTLGHDLTVDVDYGVYDNYANNFQPNLYYNSAENVVLYENNFKNNTSTLIGLWTGKADYEQNFLKGKLGLGVKTSIVNTDNSLDFFNVIDQVDIIDSSRTNTFEYYENINAGYVNYNVQKGKFTVQAGLRAEQTVSKGELVAKTTQDYEKIDRNYVNYFPSAAVTYQVNEKNSLNLTYSRRIDRPSYQNLNPFEYRLDELSYSKGNVNLRPQMTNSIDLTHTFMYMVNTTVSYARTDDFFTEITDTTETTRSYISPKNLGYQEYYSFNIGTPLPLAKWWNGYLNFTLTHLHNSADFGEGLVIDLRQTNYNVYMQHSFTVSKSLGFEVSGWYSGPGVWGGTFKNDPLWSLDLGMKKTFMDDKAALRLSIGDVFWSSRWRGVSDYGGLYMDAKGGWESRQFRASFSYNFGNQNIKARDRKTASDDIKKRI
jgi:iron complex outermembrane receptor protein